VIVDVLRQVADWLGDETTGVNALLAAVPQDEGASAPPEVVIKDETRAAWVARRVIPREKVTAAPLLLVLLGEEGVQVPLSSRAAFPPGTVPVEIWYVARKTATEELVADAFQTLRAAGRVLAGAFSAVSGALTRNDSEIEAPQTGRIGLVMEQLSGDELVVARLTLAVPAVDPWGLAAIPVEE
jgi:hypothetical protein